MQTLVRSEKPRVISGKTDTENMATSGEGGGIGANLKR